MGILMTIQDNEILSIESVDVNGAVRVLLATDHLVEAKILSDYKDVNSNVPIRLNVHENKSPKTIYYVEVREFSKVPLISALQKLDEMKIL